MINKIVVVIQLKVQTYPLGSWENRDETMTFESVETFLQIIWVCSYLSRLFFPNLSYMFFASYLCHNVPSA